MDSNELYKTTETPTLWFDKDGILAKYDYGLYHAENGCTAPWQTKNAHVFRYLPVHENMMEAFKRLYAMQYQKPAGTFPAHVRILTSVADGITMAEQVLDTYHWIKDQIPEFHENHLYAVAIPKQDVPVKLRCMITPNDILVDDYNKNLWAWQKAGGTAIKGVNGINSINEAMPNISTNVQPDDIVNALIEICNRIRQKQHIETGIYGKLP